MTKLDAEYYVKMQNPEILLELHNLEIKLYKIMGKISHQKYNLKEPATIERFKDVPGESFYEVFLKYKISISSLINRINVWLDK